MPLQGQVAELSRGDMVILRTYPETSWNSSPAHVWTLSARVHSVFVVLRCLQNYVLTPTVCCLILEWPVALVSLGVCLLPHNFTLLLIDSLNSDAFI